VLEALVAGAIAGYALAIPLGAVGLLIMDSSLRGGLRNGLAAAYGTSTVDVAYAFIAVVGGNAVALSIQPLLTELRWLSVALLGTVAVRGMLAVWAGFASHRGATVGGAGGAPGGRTSDASALDGRGRRDTARRTFLRFVALTLVNPMTVVYFAALIVGLHGIAGDLGERAAFVGGVGLASFSWSSVLALTGAVVGRRLPPAAGLWMSLAGNAVILIVAAGITITLVAGTN
jgi:threonine/homoserine/homoserine lactone efflux protein